RHGAPRQGSGEPKGPFGTAAGTAQKVLGPGCWRGERRTEHRSARSVIDWFNIAIWSLVGTWVLVLGTLLLMYWQTLQAQKLNSANAVMNLRERFDSPRMRASRRHLSERLLKQAHQDISNLEVITFFELVGTLTHRKVLEDDLVWEAFGGWVTAYYWGLRHPVDMIGNLRTTMNDPLIFHEFEWLYNRVVTIDRHRLGPAADSGPPAAEDSDRFMARESKLESI